MNRAKFKAKSGFTLIEVLVGAALLSMMIGFIAYMIISSLRAQEFERSVRNATAATREALDRMASELRLATPLPAISSGSSLSFVGTNTLPSGVLLPDSYNVSYNACSGFNVKNSVVEGDTGGQVMSWVKNRLIFTRPKLEANGMTTSSTYNYDSSKIDSYCYVEWMVPDATPDRLYRRVYPISNLKFGHRPVTRTGITIDGTASRTVSGVIWTLDKSFFGNTANIFSSSGTSGNEADWLVVTLNEDSKVTNNNDKQVAFTRGNSTMSFIVSHPKSTNSSGGTVDPLYYTTYNRNLFNIKFTTLVAKRTGKATEIKFETQVRLQAGN
ncbi:MAG: type II secretion system protein J [Candidatus Bruticola sp.]